MEEQKEILKTGDAVPEDGDYICVPCGFREALKEGDICPECTSCLKNQKDVDQETMDAEQGLWEKAAV